jgi:phage-related tail fiber protein
MHRIDTATAQKDKFGQGKNGFTRGNPQTGTPATQLDYLYCDAIQEEIANAIESAGIKLDKSKHDQLAMAIKEYVKEGGVKLSSAVNSESETEAATSKAAKKAYDFATAAQNSANRSNINADNAHSRINEITDKFQSDGFESRVYSHDKRFYLIVRDDGVVGMYNTVRGTLPWGFAEDGVLGEGYVPANRVLNLEQYIRNFTLPSGVPLPWPQVHPPTGYFECNGAQFNVNQFPRLAAAYPAGRLPDLRGEFIRGWDNARGADPYRVMLSWQSDAIRNISGSIFGTDNPVHGFIGDAVSTGGTFRVNGVGKKQGLPSGGGAAWGCEEVVFDPSIASPISHDNHPRNVAFMYIVKAE